MRFDWVYATPGHETSIGIAFSLIGDEAANTVFKLTPPPQAFPIDAHVRGLVAHLAYAAAADGVYHVLRKVAG